MVFSGSSRVHTVFINCHRRTCHLIAVGSLAVSFAVFTSPPPETVAVLVTVPGAAELSTLTVKVIAELAPAARIVFRVHVAELLLHDQPLPDKELARSPTGSVSFMVILPLVAKLPIFCTLIVYVPDFPRINVDGE